MTAQHQRLAAYGVCVREEQLLLARWASPDRTRHHWTLPGGKVEHAEDPLDAVVREVAEETGFEARVERLLGVDSRTGQVGVRRPGRGVMHHVGVFYRVGIVGGALRNEVNGSTDQARWFPLEQVPELERSVVIDIGLALHRTMPADGHVAPVPVGGLLRR
ncbi:NUDIX hydrolase [Kineosporia sp. J2-2]|uniref:NUDIX hydrolase n=1 Tax=Kineosporia corallincola TaxID=2835133 RepID=A0ABS5TBC1_9ACTN|nr:NUDIX hydrolase [Kineosporia corallincola]MBT0768365.1 NUDIX hydrolase [Kineosporia corallincola]